METSSSSNPKPINGLSQEELELENLWSELQGIKKLYGLLHKNNSKIPDGDGANCLDEKTRVVLKKLLDGATQQALQSQAKLLCYTPESHPPPPSEKTPDGEPKTTIDEEVCSPEKLPKQHLVGTKHGKNEIAESTVPSANALTCTQNPKKDPDHHRPVPGLKINRKSRPDVNGGDLTRQNSKAKIGCYTSELPPPSLKGENRKPKTPIDEEAEAPGTLQKWPLPIVNICNLSRQNSQNSIVSKRLMLPPHHPFQPHIHHHRDRDSSRSQTRNKHSKNTANPNTEIKLRQTTSEDLLAIVPAEKRARVEPTDTLVPFTSTNQTRIVGRIDRELTHSKRSDTKVRPTQRAPHESTSKIPSRIGSKKDRRTASKTPSQMGSVKDHENRKQNYRLDIVPRKPPRHTKKSTAYSSSSSTSQSDYSSSSISSSMKKSATSYCSQRPHRKLPGGCKNVGPRPRGKAKNTKTPSSEKKEGRLKRIKNKLAVIFHHHHHHHHHIHDGQGVVSVQDQKHRSPWTYLKSMVPHTSRGKKDGDKLAGVRVEEKRHGYLHALLAGMIRHVWGRRRRRRRKGVGGKVRGAKRLHWWQRIRRRVVVRLANKKMPRLRLGFRRSHSKNGRNKKG